MAGSNVWWERAVQEGKAAVLLNEKKFLLQAYHHAGQAIEFGIKAIYIRRNGLSSWPEQYRGANWHSLVKVSTEAGLDSDINTIRSSEKDIFENWLTARDWDSNGRFPGNTPNRQEQIDMVDAACHRKNGVLKWLETIFQSI